MYISEWNAAGDVRCVTHLSLALVRSLAHAQWLSIRIGNYSKKETRLIDTCEDVWTRELCSFFERVDDCFVVAVLVAFDIIRSNTQHWWKKWTTIKNAHFWMRLCVRTLSSALVSENLNTFFLNGTVEFLLFSFATVIDWNDLTICAY